MLRITALSSAIVMPREAMQWQKGEFEAWRETASRQVLADRNISPAAKVVYHALLWHVNRASGGWTLLVEMIAAEAGMSARHARRGAAQLEAHGYVKRDPRPGRSNFYLVAGGGNNLWRADRSVRGGGQIRPGAKGTGRTDSSAITQTPESYPRRSFAFRGGSRGSAKSPTEPERSKDKRGRPLWQSLEALAEAVAARTNGAAAARKGGEGEADVDD